MHNHILHFCRAFTLPPQPYQVEELVAYSGWFFGYVGFSNPFPEKPRKLIVIGVDYCYVSVSVVLE
jgi:hypothetical protein